MRRVFICFLLVSFVLGLGACAKRGNGPIEPSIIDYAQFSADVDRKPEERKAVEGYLLFNNVTSVPYAGNSSGLEWQMYINGNLEIIIAFGVKVTQPRSWNDLAKNAEQEMLRFEQATQIVSEIKPIFQTVKISYTGYSLGGGLAAAIASQTGAEAVTFNAAGVSAIYNGGLTAHITNYHIRGEVLSQINAHNSRAPTMGKDLILLPALDDRHKNRFELHKLETVFNALGIKWGE